MLEDGKAKEKKTKKGKQKIKNPKTPDIKKKKKHQAIKATLFLTLFLISTLLLSVTLVGRSWQQSELH